MEQNLSRKEGKCGRDDHIEEGEEEGDHRVRNSSSFVCVCVLSFRSVEHPGVFCVLCVVWFCSCVSIPSIKRKRRNRKGGGGEPVSFFILFFSFYSSSGRVQMKKTRKTKKKDDGDETMMMTTSRSGDQLLLLQLHKVSAP